MGGPPAWGLGVGLRPFIVKNKFVTKNSIELRAWTDSIPEKHNLDKCLFENC
jgi:hypothetical protein